MSAPQNSRNTREGSKNNIEAHYDLSNELFTRFLDPSMTYSSALFDTDEPPSMGTLRRLSSARSIRSWIWRVSAKAVGCLRSARAGALP
ncbi:class I SAM-dependent methyltransferase [Ornithinimicrobium sp. INDO-MA30-4]|uniref:class I SAM-dependent methyltransferase n=1 Tax=Ornithinimicrobium sp. INDO-MA30-4 TaxID=2908651 RepID=UPI0037CCABFA